jgi:hypothetical protein
VAIADRSIYSLKSGSAEEEIRRTREKKTILDYWPGLRRKNTTLPSWIEK